MRKKEDISKEKELSLEEIEEEFKRKSSCNALYGTIFMKPEEWRNNKEE